MQVLLLECRVDMGPRVTDTGLEDVAACCARLRRVSLRLPRRLARSTWRARDAEEGRFGDMKGRWCEGRRRRIRTRVRHAYLMPLKTPRACDASQDIA